MNCAIITTGDELGIDFKNENEPRIKHLKKTLAYHILALLSKGYDSFYLDCDYGVPLWAAEIICEIKKIKHIKLHIIMPYEDQASNWNEDIRDRYFAVHEQCDSVKMACTRYQVGCYTMAEDMMLAKCDRVLLCKNNAHEGSGVSFAECDADSSFFACKNSARPQKN